MFFAQHHHPAEQSQSDFTDMRSLAVTLSGTPFQHLVYHFVLTYSNWESVTVCHSETFEALSEGLQEALWRLGGVPQEHRTDNLSAATHDLPKHRGRHFTRRYRELLGHYGLRGSTNTPGRAHENGDVESSHGAFKRALDQRLRLRGSRDFASVPAYGAWVEAFVGERNAARWELVAEERRALRACQDPNWSLENFLWSEPVGDMCHVPDFLEFRRQHMETLFAKRHAASHAEANR